MNFVAYNIFMWFMIVADALMYWRFGFPIPLFVSGMTFGIWIMAILNRLILGRKNDA